ncbi:MAG: hypothetical protein AVO34_01510 [Firmicutes bacterium ML8_F2]|jgi:hypothetical protein|nr:MAG: hypothetical protein AVO34_01510 [Firmicutes bacterium ML8_F2]
MTMILQLLIPYFILAAVIFGYIYYRYHKLGPVLHRVDRALFVKQNLDSLVLIIILAVASYFLIRYELNNIKVVEEELPFSFYFNMFFYIVLIMAVVAREVEKPTLREKGIASARGLWNWTEIGSYRWSGRNLIVNIKRGNKTRSEIWSVDPIEKKNIAPILKDKCPRQSKRSRKKI